MDNKVKIEFKPHAAVPRKLFSIFSFQFSVLLLLLTGCGKEPVDPPVAPPAERVLLMYDNIGGAFTGNVNAAGAAVAAGALDTGERVVVFHRDYRVEAGYRSVVYELVKDASQGNGFRREILKEYASGENETLSKETIAAVTGYVRNHELFRSAARWGLAFGSHGKGWIPKVNQANLRRSAVSDSSAELWMEPENDLTRYLAYDSREKIDIGEYADALDEWPWDFMLLDDCFMASVEALYEMRDLADYFIASPTEIMITGFPYDRVVSTLFSEWEHNLEVSVAGVADAFVEAYRQDIIMPGYPCATISVVKTDELEKLAASVRAIVRSSAWAAVNPSTTPVQYYEGMSKHIFFDLDDYLRNGISQTSDQYRAFTAQLGRTVIFKDHTETFYTGAFINTGRIKINHYSGLNAFIPWDGWALLEPLYRETAWYKSVYAE